MTHYNFILTNCKENKFDNVTVTKNTEEQKRKRVQRVGETAANDHVKSMISPGVKTGFSSFFSFFLGRLSFNCFPFLIFSSSAWQNQIVTVSHGIYYMKSKSLPKEPFLSNCLHPSPSRQIQVQIQPPFSI